MSRSRHSRPPAPTGADLSRITQAAISLADDITRMGRSQARLARAREAVRAAGRSEDEIRRAIRMAGIGREDRRKALAVFASRAAAASNGDEPFDPAAQNQMRRDRS